MYRVLIVDDEPEIRQGLRLKADWEALQMTVVGEAGHGTEALERLQQEAVDIVITDMDMPVMNGVSFLEDGHRLYPQLKMIVITGYEDFGYARAAVRNQARDYLLKPVARDELMAVLHRVKQELDEERSGQDRRAMTEWRLSQYYREMKEHFLVQLVKGEAENSGGYQERARLFELETWEHCGVRFITAGLREWAAGCSREGRTPDKLRLAFELMGREFAAGHAEMCEVFRDPGYPALIHYIVRDKAVDAARLAAELAACITGHLGVEPALGCSGRVEGFEQWKEGFMSALLAWNLAERIAGDPGEEHPESDNLLTEERSRILRGELVQGRLDSFGLAVHRELELAFVKSQSAFVKLIFQLNLLIDTTLGGSPEGRERAQQLWLRPEMVRRLDNVDKALRFLLELAGQAARGQAAGDADDSAVAKAKQYIAGNYMYDLHLTQLAKRFNYNVSYFSELFKTKVGTSFIAYLTETRMAQAIHLLENTTLGLADIAELTGFSSASYFSSTFKKRFGQSPSDYRLCQPPEKFDNTEPKK
ncbi:response regulator [Paenibacillus albidus]|uniref:response regulator n=1 Tax=Paenibacillus albidus TaxID=2041023 RepID=UPI001BE9B459|nr:response regulator [Paenibacillus albidus]MBT2289571.1 response regulator [Paenibacillus albidus]